MIVADKYDLISRIKYSEKYNAPCPEWIYKLIEAYPTNDEEEFMPQPANSILDSLCLAHHPRWIKTEERSGWLHFMCSNCGETVTCRRNKIPDKCPNCKEEMRNESYYY